MQRCKSLIRLRLQSPIHFTIACDTRSEACRVGYLSTRERVTQLLLWHKVHVWSRQEIKRSRAKICLLLVSAQASQNTRIMAPTPFTMCIWSTSILCIFGPWYHVKALEPFLLVQSFWFSSRIVLHGSQDHAALSEPEQYGSLPL